MNKEDRLTEFDIPSGLYDLKGLDWITAHKLFTDEEHDIYCNAIYRLAMYENLGSVEELAKLKGVSNVYDTE